MIGRFDIAARHRPDGTTAIGRQAVSAPWHLSKPYWDGAVLLVQAVNATAGVFAGDRLTFSIAVEPDAAVLLTSPSAHRVHTMPTGEATLDQQLHVAPGAWLEWMPELFIPQRGARYRQTTRINVAAGGSLYAVETLAPGRLAHGEAFAFDRIGWNTELRVAGRLVLAERYTLAPGTPALRDLTTGETPRYYASILLVHPEPLPVRLWQEAAAEIGTAHGCRTGFSEVTPGVLIGRLLAPDSIALRTTLRTLRTLFSHHLPLLARNPRKQ
jgi:urease accessory protein